MEDEDRLTDSESPHNLQDTIYAYEQPEFFAVKEPPNCPGGCLGQCVLVNPTKIRYSAQKGHEIFRGSMVVDMGMGVAVPSDYTDTRVGELNVLGAMNRPHYYREGEPSENSEDDLLCSNRGFTDA